MSQRADLTGTRFERLVLTRYLGADRHGNGRYEYTCDCGSRGTVQDGNLRSGDIKSCGCLKRERIIKLSTTHGLSGGEKTPTKLYRTWSKMRQRCSNERNSGYVYYGGRGIRVCPEWGDYQAFYDWAHAAGYSGELTIERVDNDSNYEPGNCRWASRGEQARNRRNNRMLAFRGQTKTVAEWSELTGVGSAAIRARLDRHGWSVERALSQPTRV